MAIDFLTGQRLTADLLNTNLVAPDEAYDAEATDEGGWTNTSYDSGTNVCGQTFIAPESGNVVILWYARFQSNTANLRALVTVRVGTGSTLGAGTVVSAASDESALETTQSAAGGNETRLAAGCWRYVTGLTPGDTYNVVVQKKIAGAGNGSIFQRDVLVIPAF